MRHLFVGIGVGIKVQKDRFLPLGQFSLRSGNPLNDAARYRVIAANRNRSRPCGIHLAVKIRDALNARFVVVGFRQRHVTKIMNAMRRPRINVELHVHAFGHR